MSYLKKHWKQIAAVIVGLLVLYLIYRWYQNNQAAQQSTADSTATDPTANAEYQAIANALQAQGLGSAASGTIVTPSPSTPASGGMVPSSPSTVPDNSGQLMSTVQGSLPQQTGGGSVPPINVPPPSDPTAGYDPSTGGYNMPSTVPNPMSSGVGMNTAQAQQYTPNTYQSTPNAGGTSYAPQIAKTAPTPVRGGGAVTTTIFGGTRGVVSAPRVGTPIGGAPTVTQPQRGMTIAPNRAPLSTTTTVNRSSLPSGARRA